MNVLIDTNVVLDQALNREPFWELAEQVFMLAEKGLVLQITSSAVTDIYYLMRKREGDLATREYLSHLFAVFQVLDVTGADCRNALMLHVRDYEDALQAICARRAKSKYIITRNAKHYEGSLVPALTPEQFLEEWNQSHAQPQP